MHVYSEAAVWDPASLPDTQLVLWAGVLALCIILIATMYLLLTGIIVGCLKLLMIALDWTSTRNSPSSDVHAPSTKLISPTTWLHVRKQAKEGRNLLVRAWALILVLILLVATAFHFLYSDVLPRVFAATTLLGVACWVGSVASAQLYYWIMSSLAERQGVR